MRTHGHVITALPVDRGIASSSRSRPAASAHGTAPRTPSSVTNGAPAAPLWARRSRSLVRRSAVDTPCVLQGGYAVAEVRMVRPGAYAGQGFTGRRTSAAAAPVRVLHVLPAPAPTEATGLDGLRRPDGWTCRLRAPVACSPHRHLRHRRRAWAVAGPPAGAVVTPGRTPHSGGHALQLDGQHRRLRPSASCSSSLDAAVRPLTSIRLSATAQAVAPPASRRSLVCRRLLRPRVARSSPGRRASAPSGERPGYATAVDHDAPISASAPIPCQVGPPSPGWPTLTRHDRSASADGSRGRSTVRGSATGFASSGLS
jgi:hypothetical protein